MRTVAVGRTSRTQLKNHIKCSGRSMFREPWKVRLEMYFGAALWRAWLRLGREEISCTTSFLKKGNGKGTGFGVRKPYVQVLVISFSVYGVISNYLVTASSSFKLR